jgi:hypothetical protein
MSGHSSVVRRILDRIWIQSYTVIFRLAQGTPRRKQAWDLAEVGQYKAHNIKYQ